MAKKKRDSSLRFALGAVVYALVFVVLFAVVIRILWVFLDNYEKSQPIHTIDRYIESFDSEHIRAISADFVSTLDPKLKSAEDSYSDIEKLFAGPMRYAKNGAESTETREVYTILSNGRVLGTMALEMGERPGGAAFWNFLGKAFGGGTFWKDLGSNISGVTRWSVSDEKFEFSDLLNECELLAPSEWQVISGGNVLDASYITEKGIRYPSMQEAYDYGFALPTLVRYKLSNYIGELSISARDADGGAAVLRDDPAGYTLTDRCTADERSRFEDFTRRFLPLYIAFMSNTNKNASDNYARIHPYLLPGSDLESRFYNAIEGQTWSHSKGDVLHDVAVNGVFSLGGNEFLIDVDYMVDTTNESLITTENSAGMLIVAEDHGREGIFASSTFIK